MMNSWRIKRICPIIAIFLKRESVSMTEFVIKAEMAVGGVDGTL